MVLTGIGQQTVDWIHLAQSRGTCYAVVNTVMNLRTSVNCLY